MVSQLNFIFIWNKNKKNQKNFIFCPKFTLKKNDATQNHNPRKGNRPTSINRMIYKYHAHCLRLTLSIENRHGPIKKHHLSADVRHRYLDIRLGLFRFSRKIDDGNRARKRWIMTIRWSTLIWLNVWHLCTHEIILPVVKCKQNKHRFNDPPLKFTWQPIVWHQG